jgi:hypothetical protein
LQTIARAALTSIMTANPEMQVAVVINGKSGTGAKYNQAGASSFSDRGETGNQSGTIKVDASTFEQPDLGSTIEVAGAQVWVTNVAPDPVGAFWTISYQIQKPIVAGVDE